MFGCQIHSRSIYEPTWIFYSVFGSYSRHASRHKTQLSRLKCGFNYLRSKASSHHVIVYILIIDFHSLSILTQRLSGNHFVPLSKRLKDTYLEVQKWQSWRSQHSQNTKNSYLMADNGLTVLHSQGSWRVTGLAHASNVRRIWIGITKENTWALLWFFSFSKIIIPM